MKLWSRLLPLAMVCLAAVLGGCASVQEKDRQHVVIQVSDDNVQTWQTAFNVVNNLTKAYGRENVDIEMVAFGNGINSLAFDSKAASRIPGALEQGAKVYACENSMRRFKLSKEDMAPDLSYVEAGVQHIIARQRQGWTVLRP